MTQQFVIVHFDEEGELSYHICGNKVRLFVVDERCPHDRVYEMTSRVSNADIGKILKNSPIGHSGDERHPAIKARIKAMLDDRSHLSVVELDGGK